MKPLDGDAGMLLRADRRCAALTLELDRLLRAMVRASSDTSGRWSGEGAGAFGRAVSRHRRRVGDARAAIERIGGVTRAFAHELADAQLRVKRLPEGTSAERTAIEEHISESRRRLRQQLAQVESDVMQLLLREPVDPGRWTGPVLPPDSHPRWRTPLMLPPDSHPQWRTDLVLPPDSHPRRRAGPIRPLPVPADRGPGATQLPWRPPWLDGADDKAPHTRVQPIGASV